MTATMGHGGLLLLCLVPEGLRASRGMTGMTALGVHRVYRAMTATTRL